MQQVVKNQQPKTATVKSIEIKCNLKGITSDIVELENLNFFNTHYLLFKRTQNSFIGSRLLVLAFFYQFFRTF
jgi:hypothetical protein